MSLLPERQRDDSAVANLGEVRQTKGVVAALLIVAGLAGSSFGAPAMDETRSGHVRLVGLEIVHAGRDPHSIDLARVVPRGATLDRVWFVPAGGGLPQLVVASQRPPGPNSKHWGIEGGRHWQLTLWNPEGADRVGIRWVPHVLIAASPFPIADYLDRSALRLADLTGDRHSELLVTIGCRGCNHGTSVISVFATFGRHVRRIYGQGRWDDPDDAGTLRGRTISETSWGARGGRLWFDEPRGGTSVCCPAFQLRYELQWTGHGWRPENVHRIRQHYG
jgi:hypothetical protein